MTHKNGVKLCISPYNKYTIMHIQYRKSKSAKADPKSLQTEEESPGANKGPHR